MTVEERFASSHAVTVTTIILSRKRPQYIKTLYTHNYAHLGAVAVAAGVEHSPAGAAGPAGRGQGRAASPQPSWTRNLKAIVRSRMRNLSQARLQLTASVAMRRSCSRSELAVARAHYVHIARALRTPHSAVRSPQSAVRSPQSAVHYQLRSSCLAWKEGGPPARARLPRPVHQE